MGLKDKIESKLSSNSGKKEEPNTAQDPLTASSSTGDSATSGLQDPNQTTTGTADYSSGAAAMTGNTGTTTAPDTKPSIDPYTSQGQQTAADTAASTGQTGHTSTQERDYDSFNTSGQKPETSGYGTTSSTQPGTQTANTQQPFSSDVATNTGNTPRGPSSSEYGHQPKSSSAETGAAPPYNSPATTAVTGKAGGVAAVGAGDSELGNDRGSYSNPTTTTSSSFDQGNTPTQPPVLEGHSDVSYKSVDPAAMSSTVNKGSGGDGGFHSRADTSTLRSSGGLGGFGSGSGAGVVSTGLTRAREKGGEYEMGYRDALEHMKVEMASK